MIDSNFFDNDWAKDLVNEKMKLDRQKELKNEKRDKRGRLEKGSRIASRLSCDKYEIRYLYQTGHSVKQIVEHLGCSKSTVYKVIKEMKNSKRNDMDADSSFEELDSPFVD